MLTKENEMINRLLSDQFIISMVDGFRFIENETTQMMENNKLWIMTKVV